MSSLKTLEWTEEAVSSLSELSREYTNRAPSQLTTCGPAVYTWHAAPATWLTVTGTGAGAATVSVSPMTANSTRLVPVSAAPRSGVTRTVTLSHGPSSHRPRDRSST